MRSVFIHYLFNTFFIKLIFIDFPVDKERESTLLIKSNISSYDLLIFLKIYSNILASILTCLSEKFLVRITLIKSSVGNPIPTSLNHLVRLLMFL